MSSEKETKESKDSVPSVSEDAVLVHSAPVPEGTEIARGPEFNDPDFFTKFMDSFRFMGFQATSFGLAVDEINQMLDWRLSDEPIDPEEVDEYLDMDVRKNIKCKIFLGYTSNLISSGLREVIRFLAEHKLVDVIVSTAGGVEEDFIKCMKPTYLGDFYLKGKDLREKGFNRIGNLMVPNENYCAFEDWMMPILDKMLEEQEKDGVNWTPSKMIHRLGKEINDPSSVYYWCYKNDIPVYCPAITDGSIGDMIFFHSFRNPGLRLDLVEDIRGVNSQALHAKKTGMIILGGGIVKHHICNANLMRNGADFCAFVNTASEYDGKLIFTLHSLNAYTLGHDKID
jgi:deoxyhypusine synthase